MCDQRVRLMARLVPLFGYALRPDGLILCKLREGKASFFEGSSNRGRTLVEVYDHFVLKLRVVPNLRLATRTPEFGVRRLRASGFVSATYRGFDL